MGNKTQQSTSLRGLQNSAGFLQSKISERIDTRYIPKLTFVLDDGVKKSMAVSQILEQIKAERDASQALPTEEQSKIDLSSISEEPVDDPPSN
jgi:ribosome-binding factor A